MRVASDAGQTTHLFLDLATLQVSPLHNVLGVHRGKPDDHSHAIRLADAVERR